MKDSLFHLTVTIEPRLGKFRYVRSAEEAKLVMLREWPEVKGSKYMSAVAIIDRVIRGERPPSAARTAFIQAAVEARILADELVTPVNDSRLKFAYRQARSDLFVSIENVNLGQ